MSFLSNLFSDFIMNLGSSASTMCAMAFFEPEMPKSLREE
ncbi:AgrD family cyclic lactone autoinducer peptide [Paraclostridium ghonii]|nr:cyclic lactone autoinducer peptide [Paeniclostridium ghonii]MCM0164839.1 cyclic lactone autoinducer peptide [Paeniclostridium ghonii]